MGYLGHEWTVFLTNISFDLFYSTKRFDAISRQKNIVILQCRTALIFEAPVPTRKLQAPSSPSSKLQIFGTDRGTNVAFPTRSGTKNEYVAMRKCGLVKLLVLLFYEVQNQTSNYSGVPWSKNVKKLQVLSFQKKYCHSRLFNNKEHAAVASNLLCDKLDIERKNRRIKTEPNKIQHVTNTFIIH